MLRPAAGRGLPDGRRSAPRPGSPRRPASPRRQRRSGRAAAGDAGADADFVPAVPTWRASPAPTGPWAVREACRDAPNDAFGYGDPRGSAAAARPCSPPTCAGSAAPPPTPSGSSSAPASPRVSTSSCARWLARGVRRRRRRGPRLRRDRHRRRQLGRRRGSCPCPSTSTASTSTPSPPAARAPCSSPRPTSGPPASCSPPSAGRRWSHWAARPRRARSSRTTTTPSSATTANRSAPCRASPPDRVVADRHRQQVAGARRCGSAGSSARRRWPTTIADEKDLDDRGSPGIDQLALATLIESGRFDRHLRRMRAIYAPGGRRSSTPSPSMRPRSRCTGLAAGFHAVAHLPARVDETGRHRRGPRPRRRPVRHEPATNR